MGVYLKRGFQKNKFFSMSWSAFSDVIVFFLRILDLVHYVSKKREHGTEGCPVAPDET